MQKNKSGKILNIIVLIILFIALYFAYQFYQSNNFNDFVRSEVNLYTSEFKRDSIVKYGKSRSYQIKSEQYNDAMFYKNIKVEKNTPYKVTCMVKTNEVQAKEETSAVGAQIAIEGTTERSVAIQGTQDWQKIEFIFNSKDREQVNIGFRLGGYAGEVKGEAWFSDFTLEEGIAEKNSEWKFGCFIFETTDIKMDEKQVQLEVTKNDISDIMSTIKRFEDSCQTLSKGKMTAKCEVYQVNTPLTKLSYDKEFGYYVAPEDVEEQIKNTVEENDFDHIFVVVRLRR